MIIGSYYAATLHLLARCYLGRLSFCGSSSRIAVESEPWARQPESSKTRQRRRR
jgi:hypothetical protein